MAKKQGAFLGFSTDFWVGLALGAILIIITTILYFNTIYPTLPVVSK